MEKDTKTFQCDGCKKSIVFDFYDEARKILSEKELIGWITIRIGAVRRDKDKTPFIADTTGHACSEKCVKDAIDFIIRHEMPERGK